MTDNPISPTGAGKELLTRERYTRLQQDLVGLRDTDRPALVTRIKRAPLVLDAVSAQSVVGLAQQQLESADQRIAELEAILANAQMIGEGSAPASVQAGYPVTVRYDDGTEETLTLVPPLEADPWRGLVSTGSPIGKALLGKEAGAAVNVGENEGATSLSVVSVGTPSDADIDEVSEGEATP